MGSSITQLHSETAAWKGQRYHPYWQVNTRRLSYMIEKKGEKESFLNISKRWTCGVLAKPSLFTHSILLAVSVTVFQKANLSVIQPKRWIKKTPDSLVKIDWRWISHDHHLCSYCFDNIGHQTLSAHNPANPQGIYNFVDLFTSPAHQISIVMVIHVMSSRCSRCPFVSGKDIHGFNVATT